jgi:hypothetical protein
VLVELVDPNGYNVTKKPTSSSELYIFCVSHTHVTHKGVVEVPVFLTEWAVKLNAIPSNTIRVKAKSINVNSLKQPVPLQAMLNATNAPKVGVVAVWNPGIEIEDSEVM